jgi:hypothetical protein
MPYRRALLDFGAGLAGDIVVHAEWLCIASIRKFSVRLPVSPKVIHACARFNIRLITSHFFLGLQLVIHGRLLFQTEIGLVEESKFSPQ